MDRGGSLPVGEVVTTLTDQTTFIVDVPFVGQLTVKQMMPGHTREEPNLEVINNPEVAQMISAVKEYVIRFFGHESGVGGYLPVKENTYDFGATRLLYTLGGVTFDSSLTYSEIQPSDDELYGPYYVETEEGERFLQIADASAVSYMGSDPSTSAKSERKFRIAEQDGKLIKLTMGEYRDGTTVVEKSDWNLWELLLVKRLAEGTRAQNFAKIESIYSPDLQMKTNYRQGGTYEQGVVNQRSALSEKKLENPIVDLFIADTEDTDYVSAEDMITFVNSTAQELGFGHLIEEADSVKSECMIGFSLQKDDAFIQPPVGTIPVELFTDEYMLGYLWNEFMGEDLAFQALL